MAGPVETLSIIARRLIQNETRFAKACLERRRGASVLFSRIARDVALLGPALVRGQLPHEACRELALYASHLAEAVTEELGPQEGARLAEALARACDTEGLYLEFRSPERRKTLVEELDKAAILIQALADGIYIPSSDQG
ncbi:MAG TPA: hypothetical protein VK465_06585 [Fibrobacteria bacterium]|nr:hypothetical protein [Fibrobacteria bacterium]